MKTPKEMREEYLMGLISQFQNKWLQEIKNGKRDEDIQIRISSISNFELILDELDSEVYTIFKDGVDTFVKMRVFSKEEMEERSEQMARTMLTS